MSLLLFHKPGGIIYDADAQALFDRCSSVSSDEKAAINITILALKAGGVWNKLDVLVLPRFFSNSTDAILNWKSTSFNATIVNSMVHTTHIGFQGAATRYLNTNFNPSTDGTNFTLDDNCFGAMICSDLANDNYMDMAVYDGSNSIQLNSREAADKIYTVNNGLSVIRQNNTDSKAYFYCTRFLDSDGENFKNSSSTGTYKTTSVALPNRNLFVGCYNLNGTASLFSLRIFGGYWVGGRLILTQVQAMTNGMETGLDSLGAGIIA